MTLEVTQDHRIIVIATIPLTIYRLLLVLCSNYTISRLHWFRDTIFTVYKPSGVGSNLQVRGTMPAQSAGGKIFDVPPPHFSLVPPT